MNMLYDSESFAVLQMIAPPADGVDAGQPQLLRQGFEIVDKRHGREVYLDGSGATRPPPRRKWSPPWKAMPRWRRRRWSCTEAHWGQGER